MQGRSQSNLPGIDVSSYQRGIDFGQAKSAGIRVVYIKATEGNSYVNPYLNDFHRQARLAGLRVGFYHYYRAGSGAITQAQRFSNIIAGFSYDCLPALDVEDTAGLDAGSLSAGIHTCLNEIAYLTGNRVMIYTYTNFARTNLVGSYVSKYPLWIADYNGSGIPGDNPIWDKWVGYQYSDSGNIGGVTVDLDEFTNEVLVGREVNMDVTQALTILAQNGIISSSDYWLKAVDVVKYLDVMLINMATKLGG